MNAAQSAEAGQGFLAEYLSRDRIEVNVQVSSKKRLLEEVADLLTLHSPELDRDTVFQVLNERERLGSTGIGAGFAIPHGRVSGIEHPIICAMCLSQPLNFESIDDQPVTFVIGLLVPADANEMHLQILARLAGAFRDEATRQVLNGCATADDLFASLKRLN